MLEQGVEASVKRPAVPCGMRAIWKRGPSLAEASAMQGHLRSHVICDVLRLTVPKLCLDHVDFEAGKRCKYLIYITRIGPEFGS